VSVLLGHEAPVTFVDFCRAVPDALVSSSFDGTCRLWDARAGGAALHVLRPAPAPAAPGAPDQTPAGPHGAAARPGSGLGAGRRRGSAGLPERVSAGGSPPEERGALGGDLAGSGRPAGPAGAGAGGEGGPAGGAGAGDPAQPRADAPAGAAVGTPSGAVGAEPGANPAPSPSTGEAATPVGATPDAMGGAARTLLGLSGVPALGDDAGAAPRIEGAPAAVRLGLKICGAAYVRMPGGICRRTADAVTLLLSGSAVVLWSGRGLEVLRLQPHQRRAAVHYGVGVVAAPEKLLGVQNGWRPALGCCSARARVCAGSAGRYGFYHVSAPRQEAEAPGMLVCSFSPDGRTIVAGASDCHVYAWRWDVPPATGAHARPSPGADPAGAGGPRAAPPGRPADAGARAAAGGEAAGGADAAGAPGDAAAGGSPPAAEAAALAAECPAPVALRRLSGHRHDVLLLLFSHDGAGFATGSRDGTVRVRARLLPERGSDAGSALLSSAPACGDDPCAGAERKPGAPLPLSAARTDRACPVTSQNLSSEGP